MAEFPDSVLRKAWSRQGGQCAACRKALTWGNRQQRQRGAWHPHHREDKDNISVANCVILCINPEGGCHLQVGHGGDWQQHPKLKGAQLPYLNAGTKKKATKKRKR